MGRKKSAPEPLSLPDPNSATSASASASSSSAAVPGNTSAPATASRSHDGGADLETVSSSSTSALSPADSRSPASASATTRTSPFSSRFAQKRPQTAKTGQPRSADAESFEQRLPAHSATIDDRNHKPTAQPHIATAYNPSSATPRSANPDTTSRKSKGGFFHFNKGSKSTNQFPSQTQPQPGSSRGETQSRGSEGASASRQGDRPQAAAQHEIQKPLQLQTSRSDISVSSLGDREPDSAATITQKNPASQPRSFLDRTKSQRDRDKSGATEPREPREPMPALVTQPNPPGRETPPLKTAPAIQDRSFREMMDSSVRNRSEDRVPTREGASSRDTHREREQPRTLPSSSRENGGSTFLSGLKSSSTKAAGMFGRSLFGKGHRSASSHEKEPHNEDEHYEIKVLNLPLAAQTRRTRISKRLEDSRDKTEFWMPAFPWRAIDYLNYKGCEVEGLYRVPGSGPQIKKWQRKFDEQHDVNLFEAEDLYDINIIGSMLKAWLRELPDELFPKASQERISRECAGSETVPQLLIDELSNLSPFQYYLLFAITCHLSLLLAHSDKNKMDFRNLCICFQPCMKIDAFCFKFLVCDWRDCWKGCKNEAAYIEQEYILLEQPPPTGLTDAQQPTHTQQTEQQDSRPRTPSPDRSSRHSEQSFRSAGEHPEESHQDTKLPESRSKQTTGSRDSTISTTLSINTGSEREHSKTGDLHRLSPIKPLSPLGFH